MAESVQDQGLSAGTSEFSKERGEAVGSRRSMKQARHAVTRFRGVRPKANGRFGAQIWDPSRGGYVWLGTFDAAEDAAQAYGAAAVELQAEGRVAKKTAARLAARNEYRGVQRTLSGRYAAQIGHSRGKARTWLGTFATAEDAARAYDAAAGKLHGARAITNFEQPSDDKGATEVTIPVPAKSHSWTELRGVRRTPSGKYGAQIGQWERKARTPLLGTFGSVEDAAGACDAASRKLYGAEAKANIEQPPAGATADDGQESSVDLLNDFFSEMPALQFLSDSSISGAQLDDLWASLPPAERQLVDGFLKDTDFSAVVP